MAKRKKTEKPIENVPSEDLVSRMLARCENCKKDYLPRGRGGFEISNLKLFYIPNDKLKESKRGVICPKHRDEFVPAGLILSEDCLLNKYGSAMGMISFEFSES